jgi:hypothetical protein
LQLRSAALLHGNLLLAHKGTHLQQLKPPAVSTLAAAHPHLLQHKGGMFLLPSLPL